MPSPVAYGTIDAPRRGVSAPPWLLFPVGFALVRLHQATGELWWLMAGALFVLDIVTVYGLLRIAGRYPLGRRQPLWHVAPYVLAAIVFASTSWVMQRTINEADALKPPSHGPPLHDMLISFLIWSGVAHGIVYLRRFRAEEAHELRLRLDLAGAARTRAEAELRSFEAELNPRFLIGALRSAAAFVESDPNRSERLLVEIGDVVRSARPAARAASLGDEIAALAPFIALERSRLNQDIALTSRVPDDLLDAPMPPMVLAALVRESLRTTSGAGAIGFDIAAKRVEGGPRGEQIQVDVSCTLERSALPKTAVEDGVFARTIEHLRDAYAGEATIEVVPSESGVRMRLLVPLHAELPAAPIPPAEDAVPSPQRPPRADFAVPVILVAWFAVMSAWNIGDMMTDPLPNGLLPPAHLAIIEALHAAASTTLVLYMAIRMTRRGFGPRTWGLHAMVGVALGLVVSATKTIFVMLAGHPYPPHTFGGFVGRAVGMVLIYSMFAGIAGAFEYARRYRGAEQKNLRLRTELAEAERRRVETELRALKAELNPHFLGNALTGASSVMQDDPAAARAVLTQLADVLGAIVARVGTQEVTLQEEIEGLASFIAVEQSRLGDRLVIQLDVDDDARAARVPHMILQPLVENAVKHGLAGNGGRIVVAGRRDGDRLELFVRDNGVGPEQARRAKRTRPGGVGLSNSRARLEQLYGGEATLQLDAAPAPETGAVVKVSLPWH